MKKYIKYLLSLAVVFTAASCTKTVSLDDSIDNRVNKVINGYIEELSTAENGWILNLMTDEGIYRFWMDFTNNNVVTMYTDNIHYPEYKSEPQTSTYNIRALLLPTLSFDTYSYIHIPNDPNNDVSFGTDENKGLNTDFEFEINDYKDGYFSLTGRISRVAASLTRATYEDKEAVQKGGLMDVLLQAKSYKKEQYLITKIGGTDISVRFNPNPRKAMFSWKDADGYTNYVNALTYMNLNRDIILDEPTMINGSAISAFRWDDASQTYTTEMPDGTTSPVIVQNTPLITLYDMLGQGKAFSTMYAEYEMFAAKDLTEEQLKQIESQNAFFKLFRSTKALLDDICSTPGMFGDDIVDGEFGYFQFEFYNDEKTGRPRMRMTLCSFLFDDTGSAYRWNLPYSFQLTPNESKSQFIVGPTVTSESEDAKFFASQGLQSLLSFFKGSTFQADWSQLDYNSELMGELNLIPSGTAGAARIYGALYE